LPVPPSSTFKAMQDRALTVLKPDSSFAQLAIRIGRAFFARRLLFGLIIALLAAFFIRVHLEWNDWPIWRLFAALLVVAGLFIRGLAGGFAGHHTRTEQMEAPRLANGGPYAFVRNSIYLGSMVIGLGMVILLANWIALIPYCVVFAVFS
jgi:protein-S-isoprenylcysteine O-methyltransferase Ste14